MKSYKEKLFYLRIGSSTIIDDLPGRTSKPSYWQTLHMNNGPFWSNKKYYITWSDLTFNVGFKRKHQCKKSCIFCKNWQHHYIVTFIHPWVPCLELLHVITLWACIASGEILICVNVIDCSVSNEINTFGQTHLLFWFTRFIINLITIGHKKIIYLELQQAVHHCFEQFVHSCV